MRLARLVGILAVLALGQAQAESQTATERAREILSNPAYQKELLKSKNRPMQVRVRRSASSSSGTSGGGLAALIAWLGVGLAGGLALLWLGAFLSRRQISKESAAANDDQTVEGLAADPSLAAVQRLAAAGRYAEAIHALLLLAVQRLAQRRDTDLSSALTSRELARLLPANEKERSHFGHLVTEVERSLFGAETVDHAAFDNCLAAFRGLSS